MYLKKCIYNKVHQYVYFWWHFINEFQHLSLHMHREEGRVGVSKYMYLGRLLQPTTSKII